MVLINVLAVLAILNYVSRNDVVNNNYAAIMVVFNQNNRLRITSDINYNLIQYNL